MCIHGVYSGPGTCQKLAWMGHAWPRKESGSELAPLPWLASRMFFFQAREPGVLLREPSSLDAGREDTVLFRSAVGCPHQRGRRHRHAGVVGQILNYSNHQLLSPPCQEQKVPLSKNRVIPRRGTSLPLIPKPLKITSRKNSKA